MSKMKITVWTLFASGADTDWVEAFTTFEAAKQKAESIVAELWSYHHRTDAQSGDWEDDIQALVDDGVLVPWMEITHHDLDAVAVMATLSKEAEAA